MLSIRQLTGIARYGGLREADQLERRMLQQVPEESASTQIYHLVRLNNDLISLSPADLSLQHLTLLEGDYLTYDKLPPSFQSPPPSAFPLQQLPRVESIRSHLEYTSILVSCVSRW